MSVEPQLASLLQGHPLSRIARRLGQYLGPGCDLVSLLMLLSRAGGRLRLPINLVIASANPGAENLIASRISSLAPNGVRRVGTVNEMRNLARDGFPETEFVLLTGDNERLSRFAFEATCQVVDRDSNRPSICRILESGPKRICLGSTISIDATACARCMSGFGRHYAHEPRWISANPDRVSPSQDLENLLDDLIPASQTLCTFLDSIKAALRPEESLAFHKLLQVISAVCFSARLPEIEILGADYRVARALITSLPVLPFDSVSAPFATKTGETLFRCASASDYQRSVPDRSDLGHKVFDIRQAVKWTGHSYNTVKNHLAHLENEGLIQSSREKEQRGRGLQTLYCFVKGVTPPFRRINPFAALPTMDCNAALQT